MAEAATPLAWWPWAIGPRRTSEEAPSTARPTTRAHYGEVVRRTPLGNMGYPEDRKGLAVFLASPASDYCTGSVYAVDGGWLAW